MRLSFVLIQLLDICNCIKTLRNSLKTLNLSDNLREDSIFDLRPEQLDVDQFIGLTQKIASDGI
jgi:16S rRNA (adenine1518-N6/adenine1519-N6)-dimethyltransferase